MDGKRAYPNEFVIAGMVMVILYLMNAAGQFIPGTFNVTASITNVGGKGGERTIELVEASMWTLSLGVFIYLFVRSWRSGAPPRRTLFFAVFVLLCFVAAGEELSWGQHLGLRSPSDTMLLLNAQHESNFHNLNIALLLGLQPGHPLYSRLDNFNKVLNPLFYLFLIFAWLVLPAMKKRGWMARSRWLADYPAPTRQVRVFFAVNLAAYLVVDRFFDVGELFEFAIAIAMMFAAVGLLDQYFPQRTSGEATPGTPVGLTG